MLVVGSLVTLLVVGVLVVVVATLVFGVVVVTTLLLEVTLPQENNTEATNKTTKFNFELVFIFSPYKR